MILPKITTTQKQILFLLFKFRFLTTLHVQILLKHKNPKRTQSWLKDLKDKNYIGMIYFRNSRKDNTKPAIYYLKPQARFILKENLDCDEKALNKIYKENTRREKFIMHCLSLADIYLFFLSQKKETEELNFFTQNELGTYTYFPQELPSAYIALRTPTGTRRYFLDLFDEYTPPWVLRSRVKQYIRYAEDGVWEERTKENKIPSIFFVCPTDTLKSHIYFYTKSLLEKEYEEKITLFLTTKTRLKLSQNTQNIWEKVE